MKNSQLKMVAEGIGGIATNQVKTTVALRLDELFNEVTGKYKVIIESMSKRHPMTQEQTKLMMELKKTPENFKNIKAKKADQVKELEIILTDRETFLKEIGEEDAKIEFELFELTDLPENISLTILKKLKPILNYPKKSIEPEIKQ